MKITWLGHSAFRLEFGSSVVLILTPATDSSPSIRVRVRAETAAQTIFWPGGAPVTACPVTLMW